MKPVTNDSLVRQLNWRYATKKFNPARYATVNFTNPNPGETCPGAKGGRREGRGRQSPSKDPEFCSR